MPTYTYRCEAGHPLERFCTISEMEAFEAESHICQCGEVIVRLMDVRRHINFKEGFYEHISETGEYISNMDDLKRVALREGNYSHYAEDLGSAFPGSKSGRWI